MLQVSLPKVHYWVRSLYDAGILEIVAEQRRKGRPIKRYRAVAEEFIIPAEKLPEDYFARVMRRSNAEMIDALAAAAPEWVISGDFRVSASSPTRGSQDRILREGARFGTTTHQSGCSLRITESEARELAEELRDLRDRWIARSDDESALDRYQLDIALAPMPD
ncbi:hypothetical protein EFY87_17300 [Flexivirga caeni]|uniref:Uncharacterized protein n=1 Tax=Flexivirga caeni TaxID=2294115 RepID=A0A3M9M0Q3_9MICO|nr:hypothetical protein EFY87_17300 [Flexivirga caeni]